MQLTFLVLSRIGLELISFLNFCSSKCFFDFFELSWTEFEQVCKISKANSNWIKLLIQEPLLIVRSRTKNYKTSTKSSALHLLMILDSRKVLNLNVWALGMYECLNWGISFHISYETKMMIDFFFKTHVSSIWLSLITETYHMHLRA